jgi:hypothetical protein
MGSPRAGTQTGPPLCQRLSTWRSTWVVELSTPFASGRGGARRCSPPPRLLRRDRDPQRLQDAGRLGVSAHITEAVAAATMARDRSRRRPHLVQHRDVPRRSMRVPLRRRQIRMPRQLLHHMSARAAVESRRDEPVLRGAVGERSRRVRQRTSRGAGKASRAGENPDNLAADSQPGWSAWLPRNEPSIERTSMVSRPVLTTYTLSPTTATWCRSFQQGWCHVAVTEHGLGSTWKTAHGPQTNKVDFRVAPLQAAPVKPLSGTRSGSGGVWARRVEIASRAKSINRSRRGALRRKHRSSRR